MLCKLYQEFVPLKGFVVVNSKKTWCLTPTETIRLIKDREKRDKGVGEEGDYIPILHCHHQNDFCIKMGSNESHFNVSLIVRDKVTRQCPH